MGTIIETIPLAADDLTRGRKMIEIAETCADLKEAGLDPVVLAETTSGGDTIVIQYGDDDDPLTAA